MAATAGFMTHVTCRLTAKNRDQLRNPTLGNRVWATFTFFYHITQTECNYIGLLTAVMARYWFAYSTVCCYSIIRGRTDHFSISCSRIVFI